MYAKTRHLISISHVRNFQLRMFTLATVVSFSVLSLFSPDPVHAMAGGKVAVPGLSQGAEARALGMAGAYSAVVDGADSIFWNPAGLARASSYELILNHQLLLDVLKQDVGAFVVPSGAGRVGIGYTQLKSDPMSATDVSGNVTGSFRTQDQLFVAAYGRSVEFGGIGVTGKIIKSDLGSASASAYAADFGAQFKAPYSTRFMHSLVIQNIGSRMRYSNGSEELPVSARFGTAFRPSSSLQFGLDFSYGLHGSVDVAGGGELGIPFRNDIGAFLRAGYASRRRDSGDLAGLAIGAGLSIVSVRLDYAWTPSDDLGGSQIFTLTYKFGDTSSRPASLQNSISQGTQPTAPRPVYSLEVPFAPKPLGESAAIHPVGGTDRKSRVYVVKEGDTLKGLAQRFYGKADLWMNIQNENRLILGNNSDLIAGQKILLQEQ